MSEDASRLPSKLDPWLASSLLQKAIRRGEVALAQHAARLLYRYRGPAVFRRLATIAIEDIGIADLGLVSEVVMLGTDAQLRSVLGSDVDLLNDVCRRLAEAPKDRSADYLNSAATATIRSFLSEWNFFERGQSLPPWQTRAAVEDLVQSAVDALLFCTSGRDEKLKRAAVEQFILTAGPFPAAVEEIVLRLASTGAHPFCLMLLPLSSAASGRCEQNISTEVVPPTEFERGVPLWILDMHTAAGKMAIRRFAVECAKVRKLLAQHVPSANREQVAFIASFYADAAPVSRKLAWKRSDALRAAGLQADMMMAGCPQEAALPIVDCVTANLPHLNEIRRAVLRLR